MSRRMTFKEEMDLHEIMLRGQYLSSVSKFEYIIVEIISLCFYKEKESRKSFKEIMIEGMGMDKKIKLVIKSLKNYNTEYYEKFKTHF